jgi:hypothetical protein
MQNLNEIIQSAHDGNAIGNLAEQFGISPQQAQAAVQALLPSLSMGLQQQMAGGGFDQILGHLATQQNVAAYEDSDAAQTDETLASGTDVLNQLFGNEDVTQQVTEHAAQHSAVGSDLLQSMLPVIAAMVMGGLFKSIAAKGGLGGMFGQAPAQHAAPPASSGGGLGDILGQLTGQRAQTQPAAQNAESGGLGDLLGQLLGGNKSGQPGQSGGGGLGDILGQLTGGKAGSAGGGGLGDILGQLSGGAKPGASGGGLGDILGQLTGGKTAAGAGAGGGLGGLLGGLLGGSLGGGAAHGQPQASGGIDPSIQAGLQQLQNMFGHGTNVAPQQQSGLEGILGQLLGGGRR